MMGSLNQFVLVSARKSRGGEGLRPSPYMVKRNNRSAAERIANTVLEQVCEHDGNTDEMKASVRSHALIPAR
jgi:hypothetical protein